MYCHESNFFVGLVLLSVRPLLIIIWFSEASAHLSQYYMSCMQSSLVHFRERLAKKFQLFAKIHIKWSFLKTLHWTLLERFFCSFNKSLKCANLLAGLVAGLFSKRNVDITFYIIEQGKFFGFFSVSSFLLLTWGINH